ncbi:Sodium/sulfate symporter [Entophlyctis helioformis]|nr:Sodium/sulfate symporter [Entophlyctis helioformis]
MAQPKSSRSRSISSSISSIGSVSVSSAGLGRPTCPSCPGSPSMHPIGGPSTPLLNHHVHPHYHAVVPVADVPATPAVEHHNHSRHGRRQMSKWQWWWWWGHEWRQRHSDRLMLLGCVAVGAMLWTLPLPPSSAADGLSAAGMHLLAVFISVMLALMTTEVPIAIVVSVAMVVLTLSGTWMCPTRDGSVECYRCGLARDPLGGGLAAGVYECETLHDGFKVALSGFAHPVAWLITCAFHLGQAVDTTQLGRRLALCLMYYWGHSVVGLGYALFAAECLLAPFVPSNTARGGGIILPIVKSMAGLLESTPDRSPALGRYLVLCGAHANLVISSLFLTGAAPNPIVAHAVQSLYPGQAFGYMEWTTAAVVPSGCVALVLPWLFAWMDPPVYDGRFVRAQTRQQLREMGPMSRSEVQLCAVLGCALVLWMSGSVTGIPEALVAMMALVAVLLLGILPWEAVAKNHKAWDTFYWLAGMLVMAEQLSALGVSKWIGQSCASLIHRAAVPPLVGAMLLGMAYFGSSVLFSSITAHAVALVHPFLEAARAIHCPAMVIAPLLATFSTLCACLTPFSTGSVLLYFAQGFVPQRAWVAIGLVVAVVDLGVYFTLGFSWWKLLGLF